LLTCSGLHVIILDNRRLLDDIFSQCRPGVLQVVNLTNKQTNNQQTHILNGTYIEGGKWRGTNKRMGFPFPKILFHPDLALHHIIANEYTYVYFTTNSLKLIIRAQIPSHTKMACI